MNKYFAKKCTGNGYYEIKAKKVYVMAKIFLEEPIHDAMRTQICRYSCDFYALLLSLLLLLLFRVFHTSFNSWSFTEI